MSDLLNQASLVMIPSGYKEDVVYSEVPTNGNGDLSFTRASNGTRINSAGLVEVCPWNLAEQSETFDNVAWIKSNANITANNTTAPNGTATADKIAANGILASSYFAVGQSIANNIIGQPYTATLYAKAGTITQMLLYLGASNGIYWNLSNGQFISYYSGVQNIIAYNSEAVGDGWYKYTISLNASSTTISFESYAAKSGDLFANYTTADNYYLWGAQLNIGSTAKPYFPTTDRLNVPRLTYQNGGGGCPSLLLEKQSTNLAFPSEDLTAWGTGGMTNTANQTTSPDGTQNADKSTIGSTTRYYDVITQGITTVIGTTYTTSFYAKKGTGIEAIYFYQGDGTRIAKWNLNNGAYIGYAPADGYNAFTSQTSESIGNGWYRFTATYTASSTSGNLTIGISTNTNDSVTPLTGNGTDFVYVWGLQYEASSYKTSYIPTTSSSATRVADACFKTGISSLIGQTEGTMFVDFVWEGLGTANVDNPIFSIGEQSYGTSNIAISNYNGALYGRVTNGTSVDATVAFGSLTIGTRYKCAIGYANNDFIFYVNGANCGNDTSVSIPALSNAYFQNSYPNSKKVNQAAIFKTRLTNAELASLTTI